MAKYREKTKQFDAMQYTGKLAPAKKFLGIADAQYDTDSRQLIIPTTEEQAGQNIQYVAEVNDWILKDENGSISVCKPEQFEAYELVK